MHSTYLLFVVFLNQPKSRNHDMFPGLACYLILAAWKTKEFVKRVRERENAEFN